MRISLCRILLAIGALAAPTLAVAGPWVDPRPGHGYVSLSYNLYQADQYYSGPGEVDSLSAPLPVGTRRDISVPIGSGFGTVLQKSNYTDKSAFLYGEVSLYGGLGFTLAMPIYRGVSQALDGKTLSNAGVGDLNLGLKYMVPAIKALRGFAFGPQLYFTAPTGDQNGRGAFPMDSQAPLPLPLGNGTGNMELRGSFGYSFYPIPMFVSAEVGYRHHFISAECTDPKTMDKSHVNYSDDVPWTVQVGGSWAPKKKYFDHLTVIATVHGAKSMLNGDVPEKKASPYLAPCGQANNQDFLSMGGTLMVFPIKWIGLVYSVEHTLLGANTGYGLTNSIGLATEF